MEIAKISSVFWNFLDVQVLIGFFNWKFWYKISILVYNYRFGLELCEEVLE